MIYQYQREKEYKIDVVRNKMQDYNYRLNEEYLDNDKQVEALEKYIERYAVEFVRVTLMDLRGNVIYDSHIKDLTRLEDYMDKREIASAITRINGYDIRPAPEAGGVTYFYSAVFYGDYIIRTAVPHTIHLMEDLKTSSHYIWFTIVIALVLIFIFFQYISKLGTSIRQLKEFSMLADKEQPIDTEMTSNFPNNELGEISQNIIRIYKRLHDTKEALSMEREKLITHLQISSEGVAVFTEDKKVVLANNLFIQYSNIISDSNLGKTEYIFSVPEFSTITEFVDHVQKRPMHEKEKRMALTIDKNGRIFMVECIVFQDLSFEISVKDTTHEEEQNRLKRQLTQNIAHELKTPVSSIQGYLETIVNNANIPEDKIKLFLERSYAQSNRLSRLLRDISVLTRMDEASDMMEMERVDISQTVANIINEVNMDIETKHILVVNSLPPNICIRGNYSLIYSIFRNLMDNAIAYAGNNIHIVINCFREDEYFYYFSFADTGIGVAPEHLNRLFERFYRIDKGRSRKLGGTGLGLAIVKNAVIIHGGNISAKNNAGGGLEFVFTLAKDR